MASSIPYAVNNFMALMNTVFAANPLGYDPEFPRLDATKYQVWFGSVMPKAPQNIMLAVTSVAGGDQKPAEMGINYKREEEYVLECELTSHSGDADFLSRMNEVFSAWRLITTAVANDPSLTGVPNTSQNSFPSSTGGVGHSAVRFAQIKNMNFVGKPNTNGQSVGVIMFDIHCEARIESLT